MSKKVFLLTNPRVDFIIESLTENQFKVYRFGFEDHPVIVTLVRETSVCTIGFKSEEISETIKLDELFEGGRLNPGLLFQTVHGVIEKRLSEVKLYNHSVRDLNNFIDVLNSLRED